MGWQLIGDLLHSNGLTRRSTLLEARRRWKILLAERPCEISACELQRIVIDGRYCSWDWDRRTLLGRFKPPFVREGLGGRHHFLSRGRIRGFRFASSRLAAAAFLPGRYGGRDCCDRRFRSVWYGCGDCLSFGEISAAARECTRCKCIHAEHDNSVSVCGESSSTVINRPCIRYHTLEHVITIASAQNTILKYKKVGKNARDDAVPEEHTDSFSSASPSPPAAFSVADVRIRSLHILRVFTEGLYALAQADV